MAAVFFCENEYMESSKKKAAVLLRGLSHCPARGVDYVLTRQNILDRMLGPLRRDREVHVYVATYESPELPELLAFFAPIHEVVALPLNDRSTQADTFRRGLEAVRASGHAYGTVVASRFDVEYALPWDSWPLPLTLEDAVCVLWKEKGRTREYVCDVLFVFPGSLLDLLISRTLEISREKHMHGLLGGVVPTLLMYPDVRRESNTDIEPNPFYRIVRTVDRKVEVPKNKHAFFGRFVGVPSFQ